MFILKLLEAAGDIFFNSCLDQHKAITFYRVQSEYSSSKYNQISLVTLYTSYCFRIMALLGGIHYIHFISFGSDVSLGLFIYYYLVIFGMMAKTKKTRPTLQ